jgi:hypothetical protein
MIVPKNTRLAIGGYKSWRLLTALAIIALGKNKQGTNNVISKGYFGSQKRGIEQGRQKDIGAPLQGRRLDTGSGNSNRHDNRNRRVQGGVGFTLDLDSKLLHPHTAMRIKKQAQFGVQYS